jgi:hypothetical protein
MLFLFMIRCIAILCAAVWERNHKTKKKKIQPVLNSCKCAVLNLFVSCVMDQLIALSCTISYTSEKNVVSFRFVS